MSFSRMRWAVRQLINDPAAKLLLILIANYANERGKAWPTQERLAVDCGMSERSIRYKLDVLEELGLLTIKQIPHRGGRKSIYFLSEIELSNRQDLPVQPAEFAGKPIKEPINLSLSGEDDLDPPKSPSPSKPRTPSPLPDAWEPSSPDLDWAAEALPTVDVQNETAKFREHYQSKGEQRADWGKCWRLWLRRCASYQQRHPAPLRPAGGRPRGSEGVRERAAAYLASRGEPVQARSRRDDEG